MPGRKADAKMTFTKTEFGKVDAAKATGWTLGYRGGKMEHLTGCSRESAVSIAQRKDAMWCRPHRVIGSLRVVNLPS